LRMQWNAGANATRGPGDQEVPTVHHIAERTDLFKQADALTCPRQCA
jgi:hypothetical protein